jgi:hypothetical protein
VVIGSSSSNPKVASRRDREIYAPTPASPTDLRNGTRPSASPDDPNAATGRGGVGVSGGTRGGRADPGLTAAASPGAEVAPPALHPQPQQPNPAPPYGHHPQQHHQLHHAGLSFVKTEDDDLASPYLNSHPSSNESNSDHPNQQPLPSPHHLPANASPTSVYFHPGTNGAGARGMRYNLSSHGGGNGSHDSASWPLSPQPPQLIYDYSHTSAATVRVASCEPYVHTVTGGSQHQLQQHPPTNQGGGYGQQRQHQHQYPHQQQARPILYSSHYGNGGSGPASPYPSSSSSLPATSGVGISHYHVTNHEGDVAAAAAGVGGSIMMSQPGRGFPPNPSSPTNGGYFVTNANGAPSSTTAGAAVGSWGGAADAATPTGNMWYALPPLSVAPQPASSSSNLHTMLPPISAASGSYRHAQQQQQHHAHHAHRHGGYGGPGDYSSNSRAYSTSGPSTSSSSGGSRGTSSPVGFPAVYMDTHPGGCQETAGPGPHHAATATHAAANTIVPLELGQLVAAYFAEFSELRPHLSMFIPRDNLRLNVLMLLAPLQDIFPPSPQVNGATQSQVRLQRRLSRHPVGCQRRLIYHRNIRTCLWTWIILFPVYLT